MQLGEYYATQSKDEMLTAIKSLIWQNMFYRKNLSNVVKSSCPSVATILTSATQNHPSSSAAVKDAMTSECVSGEPAACWSATHQQELYPVDFVVDGNVKLEDLR
jgi:hypothetical protein